MAPPTAASIVANGVKANGKAPEPVAEETPAPTEEASKVEAKEDGEEEVRAVNCHCACVFVD